MDKIKYAIVHGGRQAHRDEIMAMGLAIYIGHIGLGTRVFRRDPTEEELNDPHVLVLDVGGRHEPDLNNFDHHMIPAEEETCALTLVAQAFPVPGAASPTYTFHELFSEFSPWYQATATIDTRGPTFMARRLGLKRKLPMELRSPFEMAIIEAVSNSSEIDSLVKISAFQAIGNEVAKALALRKLLPKFESFSEIHEVGGLKVLLVPRTENLGIDEYAEVKGRELGEPIAVSVSHDDRGAGLSLYRFDDDERIDFSKLDGKPNIVFAHNNGFLAKTKSRDDDWKALIEAALV